MLPSKGGGRIRDGQQIKLPLHTCVPSEPFPSLLHNFVKKTQKRHCDKELNIISLREALKKIVFFRNLYMTHSQMLGKFEYTRGPIFKVVLEC